MKNLANEFKQLSKIAHVNHTISLHMKAFDKWAEHKHLIHRTLEKIRDKAEQGGVCLYLSPDDPFFTTPAIHDFFTQSGFTVNLFTIEWDTNKELR